MDKITLTLTLSLDDAKKLMAFIEGTDAEQVDETPAAAPRKKAAKKTSSRKKAAKKATKKPAPEDDEELGDDLDLKTLQAAVKENLDTVGTESTREVFKQFKIKKISQLDEEQWQEFYDALIEAREMAE